MSRDSATFGFGRWWAAGACALAGFVMFQFFGNAARGYVDTPSVFWWWVSQWLDPQAETEHGWLILGISGWLLWRNLERAESSELRAESKTARSEIGPYLVMVLALALHAVGFVAQQARISIVAVLLFAWGVVRLGGGKRWGDAAMFPLGFMVFAIPVNVLDSVGFWLRLWVIEAAGPIAHAAGIDVVRSGTQLFAPDGRYQYDVAAACSGVRSLMALAALSLLIGYLNFRSPARRALMLALCFPLTYLGNIVRISAIIFAAQWGGQAWGERAHEVMGFGVFVIVLGGVLAAAGVLRRVSPEQGDGRWEREDAGGGGDRISKRGSRKAVAAWKSNSGRWETTARTSSAFALGVVALAIGEMVFLSRVAGAALGGGAGVRLSEDGKDPVELPAFVGTEWIGRRAEVTAVEREVLPADTGFSRRTYVNVTNPKHAVFVSIVLSGKDRTSIHRPELCLVGQGWSLLEKRGGQLDGVGAGDGVPVTWLRTEAADLRTQERVPALVGYWFVSSDAVVASHLERFFHDAWNRLRGRADRWAYVLVQTDATDGEEAARARMREVLGAVLPKVQMVW